MRIGQSNSVEDVRYKVQHAAMDLARLTPTGGTIRLPAEWWPVFYDKYCARLPSWVKRHEAPRGQTFMGRKIYWVPR